MAVRQDTTVTVGLVAAVVAGSTVAVLGLLEEPAAVSVGALFPGLIALASGAVLAWRGWTGGSSAHRTSVSSPMGGWAAMFGRGDPSVGSGPGRAAMAVSRGEPARYRQLLGLALVVWGIGQVVNGIAVLLSTPVFPTAGDLISLVAAPLAVAGVLAVPRRSAGTHPSFRLGLDSLLLGVTLALLCWRLFFSRIFAEPFGAGDLAAVVILVADVTVVCVAVLAFIRDLDRNLLLTSIGAACFSVGDLAMMHWTLQHPGQWPWAAEVLWCLAWPLIVAGLLHYDPLPLMPDAAGDPVDPDARGVMITTTVSMALLLLSVGTLLTVGRPDRVSLGLLMFAIGMFWIRDLLNARYRAQLLRRLHDEATADPLTGLANRRVLGARMSTLPPGEPWCLLTVDLDGFKDVNDLLGHATGDRLLVAVAETLTEASPGDALVSRLGGDEFAVLLPGEIEVGSRVGERIVTAVRQSATRVEGVARVEVSASIGVAAVHATAKSMLPGGTVIDLTDAGRAADAALAASETLPGASVVPDQRTEEPPPTVVDPLGALSASGAALRMAKAGGRNRVEVYDVGVAQVRQRRLRVEERLRSAVETGAITVLFQPIVDLRRGVVAGAEALARWTDPQLGRVGPEEFITVAEQTGLVVEIGESILEQTLSLANSEGLFARGLRLSCNVSPVQLRVAGFHQVVAEAMAHHKVNREQLVIEVTEQVLVEEGQAAQTLHRLAGLGVTIAIDDFGTGYSALGYLQRLPADILKIDRSLTSSLVSEPRSRAITRAVLDLSRTVGVSVVVEGVETSQVDDLVRRMGVGFGQGLHYGEAMSAVDLAAMADRLSGAARVS